MKKSVIKARELAALEDQLIETRADFLALSEKIDANEDKTPTEEQQKQYDSLQTSLRSLKNQVSRKTTEVHELEISESQEARTAFNEAPAIVKKTGDNISDAGQRYSVGRAFKRLANQQELNGVEAEMDKEGRAEMLSHGINDVKPNSASIPSELIRITNDVTRAQQTVGANSGADGGKSVNFEYMEMLPTLRVDPVLSRMGMRTFGNVNGNLKFRRGLTNTTHSWLPEGGTVTESKQTIDDEDVVPKRSSVATSVSDLLLVQSDVFTEQYIRSELEGTMAIGIDYAGLHGDGSANVPQGLDGVTGINEVALGTNGAAITRADLISCISSIWAANAELSTMQFLTTPEVKAYLMDTKEDANDGHYIWKDNNTLVGYQAMMSNQVRKDLTKGTGTNLHALFFGCWDQLHYYAWTGMNFIVDPYSAKKENEIEIVVNSWGNFFTRYPKAFTVIKDIVV